MSLVRSAVLVLVVVSLLDGVTSAAELGAPAPPLKLKAWIKGAPFEIKPDGPTKAYVIEFWATWCGPCRRSIPHLTALAKHYKDKGVMVVGISDEEPAKVKPFVDNMGAKMDYPIAIDNERATSTAYPMAYGAPGIPWAFIVDQKGRVVWHGNPLKVLEPVLEQVLAGKSDPKELASVAQRAESELSALQAQMINYLQNASLTETADNKAAEQLLSSKVASPQRCEMLLQLAQTIVTNASLKTRDFGIAVRAAQMAGECGLVDAQKLDILAQAQWLNGSRTDAVKTLEKAIDIADAAMKPTLQQRLAQYKAESTEGP
jgi:thiol-disulfide isomerase/thioredoxin